MAKIIYAYFNDKDLCDFFTFLETINISVFTRNNISQSEVQAISTELLTLCSPTCEAHNIEMAMCCYAGCFLQPGMIRIKEVTNTQELSVFSTIKKYIRQSYKLSKDKTYYIGPGIYNDWLQGKHNLSVLFEYDEIVVSEQDVEAIFASIHGTGFIIRANNIRLRHINNWTINDESFVICDDVNKLSKLIIRKTIVHYDYRSICIFVYKDSRRKQCRFVLDKRIDAVAQHKLIKLYEDIRKQYSQ